MQQDGVALAVQAHRHSTDRTVDHIALEGDALALEVGHETIEVLDLKRDRAACGVTRFSLVKLVSSHHPAGRILPTTCPPGCRPSQT